MNVNCSDCGSVFRVDPAKVAPEGVRAKCSICGGVIMVSARGDRGSVPVTTPVGLMPPIIDTLADPPLSTTAERMVGASGQVTPSLAIEAVDIDLEPMEAPRHLTPVAQAPIVAPPVAPPPAPIVAPPVAPPPAPVVAPPSIPRPALTPPVRSPTPRTTMPTAVPPATPIGGMAVAGLRAGPAGIAGAPARPPAAPPTAPRTTPLGVPLAATPVSVPFPATPVSVPLAPTPVSAPSVATPLFNTPVAGAEVPRRPVNPFLANDPSAKAKRLARALVSDMIAYLPQKREEGLRDGTLKQIFREEIKKSYEEYVDQIGREIAENTTHFQEALNDLLAGGQKIF